FQGLHTLILNKNRKLSDNGVRGLVNVLKDDFWLKNLSLRCCGLTKTSGEAIVELLQTNSVITMIDLGENEVPPNILLTLSNLLRQRQLGERISLRKRLMSVNKKGLSDQKILKKTKQCPRTLKKSQNRHSSQKSLQANRGNGKQAKTSGTKKRRKLHKKRPAKLPSRKIVLDARKGKDLCNDHSLQELSLRLSNVVDCNGTLLRDLEKGRKLLEREKKLRLKAEDECDVLNSEVEKVKSGIITQGDIRSKALEDSELCKDLRCVFGKLENITETKEIASLAKENRELAYKKKKPKLIGNSICRINAKPPRRRMVNFITASSSRN
ncbi:uncharacterized protein LOC105697894, partial [Orussus abietinus]|uniref:uncharacterized protein LOC105697894 n=1 Tax=Orussus abietinus TaxID=222816 RepID=UPI000C715AB5